MELFAGSEEAQTGVFLHAGYLSAYPHNFAMYAHFGFDRGELKALPVQPSLELKPMATTTPAGSTPAMQTPPGRLGAEAGTAMIALLFFLTLLGAHLARQRSAWLRTLVWVVGVFLLAGTIEFLSGWPLALGGQKENKTGWSKEREYLHPAEATLVIQRALIGGAYLGSKRPIRSLAQLEPQIAFPLAQEKHTPGMLYACKTYGLDGWGRPFRLVPMDQGCEVRSAGADGVFDNKDDILLKLFPKEEWESRLMRAGVLTATVPTGTQQEPALLFRRVADKMFSPCSKEKEAKQLFGEPRYDYLLFSKLNQQRESSTPSILGKLREKALQGMPAPEQILLLVYNDKP